MHIDLLLDWHLVHAKFCIGDRICADLIAMASSNSVQHFS
uniref:Uncharacterized protein n=1 Tax=Setaria italica TaxID=4555 RepID=K3ZEH2_SETIT